MTARYRAASLDLWFTTIFHRTDEADWDAVWAEDRARLLSQITERRDGRSVSALEAGNAIARVYAQLQDEGTNAGRVDPGEVLRRCADHLVADLKVPQPEAAERFSAAGLSEHPPGINPEAPGVVRALRGRGIPVLLLTNSARRASSWRAFLREHAALDFSDIIASCEVGAAKPDPRVFAAAAQRLGLPPAEILHVGDRWELDIEGAIRSGFGAVLYRGLWQRYPAGMYPRTDLAPFARSGVRCIDRLAELLDDGWFQSGPTG